jgi:multidrug efflux pump subunit AcrA (membrane-fusion protein)
MKEQEIMNNRSLRIGALVLAGMAALGAVYGRRVLAWQDPHAAHGSAQSPSGQRTVLYYYDAMNPQHHYEKPGKAPDGMDLVPQYANASATRNNAAQSSTQSAAPGERKVLYWYDPMHPAYKADKPGIAPDCGMQLVPKYADEQASLAKMPVGTVMIPPEKQQLIGVRTGKVERRSLVRTIHTTAQITADETKIAHIHVKVSGWIDKVYVDYVGQLVKKGQPLFTLYSPDLVATQDEYLIARRGQASLGNSPFPEVSDGSNSLFRAARDRLKLWDISDEQIKKLDETGEVTKNLTFYSPTTGFVTDRKAFPQTSVTSDTELYTISDLSTIWANADVYEYEVPYIRLGQPVELQLSYYPGRTWHGKVSYIYPVVDAQSHTVKVRIELPNAELELKPQMFADAQLKVDYGSKVVVPAEAVLDSGNEQIVFVVHDGGMFEPRRITMGPQFDNLIVVLSGLKPGEQIVVSGNFLIDSESRLKSAMGGMQH